MKLGLVGFNCRTGLGELNRQIVRNCKVDEWLVKAHRSKPTIGLEMELCHSSMGETQYAIDKFIDNVDTILFCETEYHKGLAEQAKREGKRVVCIPMQEWMPRNHNEWVAAVDLFICPTQHCYEEFNKYLPCALFPWPVETHRYIFRERTKCNQFLFINGNGGFRGRKGLQVIQEALRIWPEMPLVQHDQSTHELQDNRGLYAQGDVLLCSHTIDGLCLEILEAMAHGLPVIATDGQPWNEYEPLYSIDASISQVVMPLGRIVDWYQASALHLVQQCKKVINNDISYYSREARSFVEARSWSKKSLQFQNLVMGKAAQPV